MLRGRFSLRSIVYDIQVTCKQAADISFSRVYFEMINPANVLEIFADRASNLLSSTMSNTSIATTSVTNRECEVAELLCGVLESINNSHSHTIEVETTLDHELADGALINDVEFEDTAEETWDPDWNDKDEDDERALCKQFSLDYMTKAVNFYDEINPQTGKRKRRWEIVKNHFRRISHQVYLARFRH